MGFSKYNKSYFEVINERYSCRKFTAEKIKTEEIITAKKNWMEILKRERERMGHGEKL